MELLFTDALLLPMTDTCPRTFTGNLGISGNRIELVSASAADKESFLAAHPNARIVDCRGKLVMPGLIDTHCHAGMTLQRSYADDIALMEWLNGYIWPFEKCQTPDDIAVGMTLGIVELLLGGVTSFVDMYFHEDRGVEVARRLGIRVVLGCSYFDDSVDATLGQAERAMANAAGCSRISVAVAPHSGYTCSPENLVRGKEFCRRNGLLFMTHVAETQDEMRIMAERYGKTPVRHLDALGILDDRTIAAHCVHVDDEDIALLAERGVVVSHNPQSNMKLSSGVAPVWRMMQSGVHMTVGTDGTCSNNDLDMFEELRTATFLQKSATGDPTALPAY
ncbi:MAG: amidohydrolase, partial [Bacteroides cellulosilyticus]|nr:amidohydrolase [Bacteroides cellulosilyticus]